MTFINTKTDAEKLAAYSAVECASNKANAVNEMEKNTIDVKTVHFLQFDRTIWFECDDG